MQLLIDGCHFILLAVLAWIQKLLALYPALLSVLLCILIRENACIFTKFVTLFQNISSYTVIHKCFIINNTAL